MIDLLRANEFNSMESTFLPSHPLLSTILTLYILFLLYSPPFLYSLLLSPVLTLTFLLLLALLRLGSGHQPDTADPESETCRPEPEDTSPTRPEREVAFVGWDVKAPLEVIYEEYEGEGADDPDPTLDPSRAPGEMGESRPGGVDRWPSLSRYYPESDSGSDSDDSSAGGEVPAIWDWVLPEEEFGLDGLIEIELDMHGGGGGEKKGESLDFQAEEENLIEIDISPERNGEFLAGEMVDSRRGVDLEDYVTQS